MVLEQYLNFGYAFCLNLYQSELSYGISALGLNLQRCLCRDRNILTLEGLVEDRVFAN